MEGHTTKLSELERKYDFHDSAIEKFQFFDIDRCIRIQIRLCNWRQLTYNEKTEPETINGYLLFKNVTEYSIDTSVDIEDEQILKMEVVNGKKEQNQEELKFVITVKEEVGVSILRIRADDVIWEVIE